MQDLIATTTVESKVADIVAPTLGQMGFDLIRVRIGGGRRKQLQIMAERNKGGMEIDDCAVVSKAVSALLDVEDPISDAYTLEVSSPGIDRPLTRLDDFNAWKGHLVRIEMAEPVEGRRRFKGFVSDVCGTEVVVQSDHQEIKLEFTEMAAARLVLTDELLQAASR